MDVFREMLNNPIAMVCIALLLYSLVSLAVKGKVKSISKHGITFKDCTDETSHQQMIDNANSKFAKMEKNIQDLFDLVCAMQTDVKNTSDKMHEVELALIRLQIMSSETSMETKLTLYDTYKSKGGNSYIDMYINKLKKDNV